MTGKIITPSTKLIAVNSHKLQDSADCDRLYFWRWVLNLVPIKLNISFWYGSMMHLGLELLAWGKSYAYTVKEVKKASKEYLKKQPPMAADVSEIDIQLKIVLIMLKVYSEIRGKKMKGLKLAGTEIHLRTPLKQSPVLLVGTLDAYYKQIRKLILLEGKTAKAMDNDYFSRLKFDKQINSYAIGLNEHAGKYPTKCLYTAFRKPQIRPRKKKKPETIPEFLKRLEADLYKREDWYFVTYPHRFGKASVAAVLQDIEWLTFDLYSKYNYLSVDRLLSPDCWPRNDRQCFVYGTCPYFRLCKHYSNYPLQFRFYQMRDIRYDEEQLELNTQRKFSTVQNRMKGVIHGKKPRVNRSRRVSRKG